MMIEIQFTLLRESEKNFHIIDDIHQCAKQYSSIIHSRTHIFHQSSSAAAAVEVIPWRQPPSSDRLFLNEISWKQQQAHWNENLTDDDENWFFPLSRRTCVCTARTTRKAFGTEWFNSFFMLNTEWVNVRNDFRMLCAVPMAVNKYISLLPCPSCFAFDLSSFH